jgi:hypothetical protein
MTKVHVGLAQMRGERPEDFARLIRLSEELACFPEPETPRESGITPRSAASSLRRGPNRFAERLDPAQRPMD